jgi:putative ABC transport system permease protein
MLWRILIDSLTRRMSRKVLSVLAVWIGLTLVLGLLALSLDVGDKINLELRSFGANIKVEPLASAIPVEVGGHRLASEVVQSYLDEADLSKLKAISFFWRNNILGIAPRLRARAEVNGQDVDLVGVWFDHQVATGGNEPLVTGAHQVYTHWIVKGRWPNDGGQCLVGEATARRLKVALGDRIALKAGGESTVLTVTGLMTSGDKDDGAIIAPLSTVQALLKAPGKISGADVSALTTPDNKLAEKYLQEPKSLTPDEYERWYCTPYPGVVAQQIQEVIPGSAARVVRRVSETQGMVFSRTKGLIALLAMLTLAVCSLSVTGILTASVLERRPEMALLQAIGARRADVLVLFLTETAILGIAGGLLAAATGPVLGKWLVSVVFGSSGEFHLAVVLLAPFLGLGIAWAGGLWPVWQAVNQDAAQVLHGN